VEGYDESDGFGRKRLSVRDGQEACENKAGSSQERFQQHKTPHGVETDSQIAPGFMSYQRFAGKLFISIYEMKF
jgi:hypothetical protein